VTYFVSPQIDTLTTPIQSLYTTFWMYASSLNTTTYPGTLIVGVMSDRNNMSTFYPVDTLQLTAASTWEEQSVNFANVPSSAQAQYIAYVSKPLFYTSTYAYNYMFLDDIWISPVPTCAQPMNLTFTGVNANEITLSWQDTNSNSPSWTVEYSTHPITPGQGEGTAVYSYDTTLTLTQLQPNTLYYIYLAANCGSDGESYYISTTCRTDCSYITEEELPYTYSFEDATASGAAGEISTCYKRLTNYSTAYPYPYSYNGGHTGNFFMYFYTSSPNYYSALVLPGFENDLSELVLNFYSKNTSASYTSPLIVGVMSNANDISTFVPVDTCYPASVVTNWRGHDVYFNNYEGDGGHIAILLPYTGATCYTYVDDIRVTLDNGCRRPQDVTVASVSDASVTLAWTEVGTAEEWAIVYDTVEFDPFESEDYLMAEAYDTAQVVLEDLLPNTIYYGYVAAGCGFGMSDLTPFSFRTACAAMDSLPYLYGFEDATGTGTTHTISPCWNKGTNSTTAYPYPYTTAARTGTYGMYFYTTTSTWAYLAMPLFDYDVRSLQLNFWRKASSTSYGAMEVGVMVDPNDYSTFTTVQLIPATGNTDWTEYTVGFANYTGNGRYIAFRPVSGSTNAFYIDDIAVSLAPSCPSATNLEAGTVTGTSAILTWDYVSGMSDNVPDNFDFALIAADTVVRSLSGVTSPMLLSGLQPSTEYTAVITSSCDQGAISGGTDSVVFSTGCLMGGDIDIDGSSYTSQYTLPIYNLYGYTFSQQLVTSQEIGVADSLYGIAFEFEGPSDLTGQAVKIYLANTTLSTLTTSSFPSPSDYVLVYDGPFNCTVGWNTFTFNTPFAYNGGNLVVAVNDTVSGYPSTYSNHKFKTHSATGKTISFYSDSNVPKLSNLVGYTGSKVTYNYRANMKLITPCNNDVTCLPPSAMIDSIGTTEIALSWAQGLYETSWDVEYREGDTTWTSFLSGTTNTSAVITGLTPNTEYQVRVGSVCDNEVMYTTLSARTECAPQSLPFTENFDSWATGSSASIPSCWFKGTDYSTNYPYVNSSASTYGTAMYMYSTSTSYSYLALPVMDAPVDTLILSFQLYKTSTSYTHALQVGVMTDPEDINTFTMLASVSPEALNTWESFELNLSSYNGNGRHIAFVSPTGVYCYPYLDNITVDYIPACMRPSSVVATNISQTGATLSWSHNATNFEIEYGPTGF
ncbi:MAG: fibronectin type III domain-containing protein, partial [Bacteroidales bacterium]|nr:fibronectin type III domain-containing protein [Bacteroidales bacterium]